MKIHLCSGDIYLRDYINCDIDGFILAPDGLSIERDQQRVELLNGNPNETDLAHYFKYPFHQDATKRMRRPFIIDRRMNILEPWLFSSDTIDEIVSISAFEHFEHHTELPLIIDEAHRVLKTGGVWKFDYPDIKKIVELFHDDNPEFMAEQIYCNHKNKYSVHQWGYTNKSIPLYLKPDKWQLVFKDVVKHDYPMTGVWATKI